MDVCKACSRAQYIKDNPDAMIPMNYIAHTCNMPQRVSEEARTNTRQCMVQTPHGTNPLQINKGFDMLDDTEEQYKKLLAYIEDMPDMPMLYGTYNRDMLTTKTCIFRRYEQLSDAIDPLSDGIEPCSLGLSYTEYSTHRNTMTPQERQADLQLTQQWYLVIKLDDNETVGNRASQVWITDNLAVVQKWMKSAIVYTYPQHVRVTSVKQEALTE